jgi:hypothetical protein
MDEPIDAIAYGCAAVGFFAAAGTESDAAAARILVIRGSSSWR